MYDPSGKRADRRTNAFWNTTAAGRVGKQTCPCGGGGSMESYNTIMHLVYIEVVSLACSPRCSHDTHKPGPPSLWVGAHRFLTLVDCRTDTGSLVTRDVVSHRRVRVREWHARALPVEQGEVACLCDARSPGSSRALHAAAHKVAAVGQPLERRFAVHARRYGVERLA